MFRVVRSSVVGVVLLSALVVGPSTQAAAPQGPLADRYIVVLQQPSARVRATATSLAQQHGLNVTHVYEHALTGFAAEIPTARLAALRANPLVRSVSPDLEVHADAQVAPTGIQRAGASSDGVRQTLPNKGTGIGVAVIDTGIAFNHPDLQPNIAPLSVSCVQDVPTADDDAGHGSHVAGTIAAVDDGNGVVGMAPQAKLYAVKVLGSNGFGFRSWVICGIDWVTANAKNPDGTQRIHVANMSLGGDGSSDNNCGLTAPFDPYHQAICNSTAAGVTYVVAAGNTGIDASRRVPAAYDDTVITVSALADSEGRPGGLGPDTTRGPDDTFASFSNWGWPVAIGAPGVGILSTVPTGLCPGCDPSGYKTLNGTSMAAPHVTGAAALFIQSNPGASWTVVRDALLLAGEYLTDVCDPSVLLDSACHDDPSGLHPEPVLRADNLFAPPPLVGPVTPARVTNRSR